LVEPLLAGEDAGGFGGGLDDGVEFVGDEGEGAEVAGGVGECGALGESEAKDGGIFGEAIVGVGDAGGKDVGDAVVFDQVGFLGFAGEFTNVFAEGFVEVDGLFVEDDRDVGLL